MRKTIKRNTQQRYGKVFKKAWCGFTRFHLASIKTMVAYRPYIDGGLYTYTVMRPRTDIED